MFFIHDNNLLAISSLNTVVTSLVTKLVCFLFLSHGLLFWIFGSLLLGFLETVISAYVSTTYRDLVAYGLLVVVLIVKPNGLLGQGAYDKL